MGAFLDKPKTDKETTSGEGIGLKYGVSAMQGWRKEMEDTHVCATSLAMKDHSFFGVFDGHAGTQVSKYCSKYLLDTIMTFIEEEDIKKGPSPSSIETALCKGFLSLDEKMRSIPPWCNDEDRGGTTAVTVMLTPDKIIWGNCGDSRGILCRNKEPAFATADHKPFNVNERNRIERAGGSVMMQRVNGSLAVSRALGDFAFKKSSELKPEEQLVSPEPEVTTVERDPENDAFLLLACDGVYDVMSNEEVVEYVWHQLLLTSDLAQICSNLIDTCLNKNSRDNMSVILITFKAAPQVSKEAIEAEEKLQKEAKEAILKKLKELVEEATNPLDLEENDLIDQISVALPQNYDVIGKRPFVADHLTELKKEKFGPETDYSFNGPSDSSEAPEGYFFSVGSNRFCLAPETAAEHTPSLDSNEPRPIISQLSDDLPSPVQTDSVEHSAKNT